MMHVDRDELLRMLIPPVIALVLMVLFFAVFDRWNEVHDPINSIVALVIGVAGFAAGVGIEHIRMGRARQRSDAGNGASPSA